ncbi:hypothetical protein LINPERPRIM_LOCUS21909, partial [Linum perenne]
MRFSTVAADVDRISRKVSIPIWTGMATRKEKRTTAERPVAEIGGSTVANRDLKGIRKVSDLVVVAMAEIIWICFSRVAYRSKWCRRRSRRVAG